MTLAKALLCEKWEFSFDADKKGGFFKHTNVSELSRRAKCFEWLLEGIPEGKKVVEYFAGIGLQSVIIQELIKPSEHWVYDIEPECCEQLSGLGYPLTVTQADAKKIMDTNFSEIVFLDFPDMTAIHYKEWSEQFEQLFATQPKLVEITDVGNRYLHLHTGKYSEALGSAVTDIPSYIHAISKYFASNSDYSVVKAAYKAGTSYMLLAAVKDWEIEMHHVGPDKTGFRYL